MDDHDILKVLAILLLAFAAIIFGIATPSLHCLGKIEQYVSEEHIEEVKKESDDPYFYIICEIKDLVGVDGRN